MRTLKAFFQVSLVSGFLTLIVGAYLTLTGLSSSGETAGYTGAVSEGTITGPGAILIGVIILGVSAFAYAGYRSEKKKFEQLD